MEKDELIRGQIRGKITFEEFSKRSKEITRRVLSGGGTVVPVPTVPRAEIEKPLKNTIRPMKKTTTPIKLPLNHLPGRPTSVFVLRFPPKPKKWKPIVWLPKSANSTRKNKSSKATLRSRN